MHCNRRHKKQGGRCTGCHKIFNRNDTKHQRAFKIHLKGTNRQVKCPGHPPKNLPKKKAIYRASSSSPVQHVCELCDKHFAGRSGLWYHKKHLQCVVKKEKNIVAWIQNCWSSKKRKRETENKKSKKRKPKKVKYHNVNSESNTNEHGRLLFSVNPPRNKKHYVVVFTPSGGNQTSRSFSTQQEAKNTGAFIWKNGTWPAHLKPGFVKAQSETNKHGRLLITENPRNAKKYVVIFTPSGGKQTSRSFSTQQEAKNTGAFVRENGTWPVKK